MFTWQRFTGRIRSPSMMLIPIMTAQYLNKIQMKVTIGDNSVDSSCYIVTLTECDFMADKELLLEKSECRQLIETLDKVNR